MDVRRNSYFVITSSFYPKLVCSSFAPRVVSILDASYKEDSILVVKKRRQQKIRITERNVIAPCKQFYEIL
jgi:hypothetical protein